MKFTTILSLLLASSATAVNPALCDIAGGIYKDVLLIPKMLAIDGNLLQCMNPIWFRYDENYMELAVAQNESVIAFTPDKFISKKLVQKNDWFHHLSMNQRDDYKIVETSANVFPASLEFASCRARKKYCGSENCQPESCNKACNNEYVQNFKYSENNNYYTWVHDCDE